MSGLQVLRVRVRALVCGSCIRVLERALLAVDGVKLVDVLFREAEVHAWHLPGHEADVAPGVLDALCAAGYPPVTGTQDGEAP